MSNEAYTVNTEAEEAKWYVVHTYSGYENKVKVNIEATIENRHLEDEILEVRVPVHDVTEIKNGVASTKSKKTFPGYVLIHMIMNDDTWYVVRNTRGVTGFVGPGSKPVPLTVDEVMGLGIVPANFEFNIEVGDRVMVLTDAMRDTVGVVQSINEKSRTVRIAVDMFGMETSMELGMMDIKKIS
ncbi:MAG: transcription termination/antitermination protein NusG [Eubacteriales bacterium]|nr:transcription termination/antitermination protein NusG [Eubacteriales bacterium]